MSEIFDVTTQNISIHLSNIFETSELSESAVCKEILHTAADGKKYKIIQEKDQSAAFKKAVSVIRSTGRLPSSQEEQGEKKSTFDQQLKGLLNVPPPPKEK